jgi:hypothetical protein
VKIQLGFENVTYTTPRRGKSGRFEKRRLTKSASVARELEDEFMIVESFYNLDANQMLVTMLEDAYADGIESMTSGTPKSVELKDTDLTTIQEKFKQNLNNRRYDGLLFNTPTEQSKKSGKPSFVETGTYRDNFRVWKGR